LSKRRKETAIRAEVVGIIEEIPAKIFAKRRKYFIEQMLPNSVAFILSNPERIRSNDTDYPYRQSSDILYLSNFPEPQTVLILSNFDEKPEFKMIVRAKDRQREIWTGRRLGIEGAIEKFACQEAYTVDQFTQVVKNILMKAENVYYKFGDNEEFDELFEPQWKKYSTPLHNPETITHRMRLVKEKPEIDLMRQAAAISAEAHCSAMEVCRVGMMEYEIQAEIERLFKIRGANAPAYNSIVAGGINSIILHYTENNSSLQKGDLLLIDAACEYRGYASDITRTFPVSGKFSEEQLEIYNLVLDANKAAIAFAKAGITLKQVHEKAANILREGLIKLGVLSPEMNSAESEERVLKHTGKNGNKSTPVILRDVFMHGTSHWLGLDVHDVGTIGTRSTQGKAVAMIPGMAFTVEPGLYFDPEDKRLPKKYRGIGVRIEDDVVITTKGCEVLTSGVPKEAEEIEELMAAAR
jgi:Xaa-Pro aminopeptidase